MPSALAPWPDGTGPKLGGVPVAVGKVNVATVSVPAATSSLVLLKHMDHCHHPPIVRCHVDTQAEK